MAGPEPGPELLADPARLAVEVARVAAEISADHPRGVTLVGVLKGSVVFLADLVRSVTVPVRIDLVAVAPFDGATARTRVVKDLDQPIAGEAVVVVTGIVDTGFTADFLGRHLRGGDPASLRVAALVDKPVRRILPLAPDYVALEAPDRFLIGYGLDHAGRYRNLGGLWTVDGASLADDPDRYVEHLYGTPP
jgi:hypoxanthine phosphoribosyltransferase